jgi:hypothetical protein
VDFYVYFFSIGENGLDDGTKVLSMVLTLMLLCLSGVLPSMYGAAVDIHCAKR